MKTNILDVDNNLGKAKFFVYRFYIEIKVIYNFDWVVFKMYNDLIVFGTVNLK